MGKSPQQQGQQTTPQPMHGQNKGDRISGDSIYVRCRSPGSWNLFRMSGRHKGSETKARKNAMAVIEMPYTNVRQ
jgi:hypothetical protein